MFHDATRTEGLAFVTKQRLNVALLPQVSRVLNALSRSLVGPVRGPSHLWSNSVLKNKIYLPGHRDEICCPVIIPDSDIF